MKRMLCIAVMVATLVTFAYADGYVNVKPGPDDITYEQARELAVAFFIEKCGVEDAILRNAEWKISFGHSTLEKVEDARWTISIGNIDKDNHEGIHVLYLTGSGEVIEWSAHGGTYDKPNPELLDYLTISTPLPSDASAETVISVVREKLFSLGIVEDTASLVITPTFGFDEHFNSGCIPVWLVQIEDDRGGVWKAVVTHKGELLSMVPYVQAFHEYRTPDEQFWAVTFPGEDYFVEQDLLFGVIDCTLSFEERAAHTARWRPLVEAWMIEHPYYLNMPGMEYLVTIERIYGVPDERTIPQTQAEKIAQDALTQHLGEAYLSKRDVRVDYLVNDPEHPVWIFRFGRIKGMSRDEYRTISGTNPMITSMYVVTLDAYSGTVYSVEPTDTIF